MTTHLKRRFVLPILLTLAALSVTFGTNIADPQPASASAQTCISAPNGYVCTSVSGSGTWVGSMSVSRGKSPGAICNYSAWFFHYTPGRPAVGLKYVERAGCTLGRAWFTIPVNRHFARGTQMCAKFYENANGSFIGQRCVGIS